MALYTLRMQLLCDALEAALPQYLPPTDTPQGETAAAMRYACLDGGKRLRGVLVLEWSRVLCGDGIKASTSKKMPVAGIVPCHPSYDCGGDTIE